MALSISAFSPEYRSNVELPTTNFDLVSKVLQYKQNKFDTNFNALQGFKQSALNINFINEERRGEINKLNKDLDDKFSSLNGEFGDLSDNKTFANYYTWFDDIKKNTDLIQAYQEDKKWQTDLGKVQSLKQAKDPVKAGYSSVNEFVFNNRLNEYSKSTKQNKVDFKGYTPYTDIVGEVTKIYKTLPKKESFKETVLPGGRIIKEKINGYSYDELKSVLGSMDTNMLEQFSVEAEYNQIRGLKNNPTSYRENLYKGYNESLVKERSNIDTKINEVKQKQALSLEEEKPQYQTVLQQLEQAKIDLSTGVKGQEWFMNTNESNLLGFATQLHAERKVSGIAKGLATTPSIEYKTDAAYFGNMKLKQSSDQFAANLRYKQSQDLQQNIFKEQELQLRSQDISIKQAKENRESGKDDGSGNQSQGLFNSGKSYIDNQLVDATSISINALEDTARVRSFNIADGANYNKEFMGQKNQSNDQIMETILTMYDDNNIGQSIRKINEYVNKAGLSENISINTLVSAFPKMATDINNLDIKNKVGAAKTVLNQILSGDSVALKGKYKNFSENYVIYQNQAQEQNSLLKNKSTFYNEAVRDMKQKDWNKMTSEEQVIVSQKVTKLFMENNLLPSYGMKESSYQDLGKSPKEGQQSKFAEQGRLAKILREKSGVNYDIPQSIISSTTVTPDGTTTIYFKGEKEFKEAFGDEFIDIIKPDPSGWSGEDGLWGGGRESTVKGIKGTMKPNSYVIIKTDTLQQPSSVDRVIANNNTFFTHVVVGNESKVLKLTKVGNDYYYEIDGNRTMLDKFVADKKPSEVLDIIKKVIQN